VDIHIIKRFLIFKNFNIKLKLAPGITELA
jgi:hypothetical protein